WRRSPRTRAVQFSRSRTIRVPYPTRTASCASRTASSSAKSAARRVSRPCTTLRATERGRPMPKADSSLNMLIVAAVLALGIGYYVPQTFSQKTPEPSKTEAPKPAPKPAWAASAPGRVEPIGGEIRVTAQAPGRISDVLVGVNDKVV